LWRLGWTRRLLVLCSLFAFIAFLSAPIVAVPVHILFDETGLYKRSKDSYTEGEGYEYAIEETAWYGASTFANLLQEQGYTVDPLTAKPITSGVLNEVDLLIILGPTISQSYTTSEIEAIRAFVENGGGLFLASSAWGGPESPPWRSRSDRPCVQRQF